MVAESVADKAAVAEQVVEQALDSVRELEQYFVPEFEPYSVLVLDVEQLSDQALELCSVLESEPYFARELEQYFVQESEQYFVQESEPYFVQEFEPCSVLVPVLAQVAVLSFETLFEPKFEPKFA